MQPSRSVLRVVRLRDVPGGNADEQRFADGVIARIRHGDAARAAIRAKDCLFHVGNVTAIDEDLDTERGPAVLPDQLAGVRRGEVRQAERTHGAFRRN